MSETEAAVAAIAAELRDAYADSPERASAVAVAHYADKVEFAHEPSSPRDGVFDRETLAKQSGPQLAVLRQAVPDLSSSAEVNTVGDQITLKTTMSGTKADGSHLEVVTAMAYAVENGRIVRVIIEDDPATREQLIGALTAAGI